ncbi:MAG: outer membrane beta-barrel protein [Acidobacteria bacterium]|jgi:outer membrane protein|nr:outer membrane beta-barrel protein [Acidobacteriota bacterium]
MRTKALIVVVVALIAMPVAANAGDGDWILRARVINVSPNESSGPILSFGGEVGVDSATTLEVDVTYMFSKRLGLEVIAATTGHDLSAAGGDLAGASLGDVKVLPPTAVLQFHPLPGGLFDLYFGGGVNFTLFYSYDLSADLAGLGVTDLEFDESFGLAGNIGMNFNLGDNLLINVDLKYIKIGTDVDVMAGSDALGTIGVDIDPWVFGAGVGWRF